MDENNQEIVQQVEMKCIQVEQQVEEKQMECQWMENTMKTRVFTLEQTWNGKQDERNQECERLKQ